MPGNYLTACTATSGVASTVIRYRVTVKTDPLTRVAPVQQVS
jgi:hypothetical protein